jgi:hypothetical protein
MGIGGAGFDRELGEPVEELHGGYGIHGPKGMARIVLLLFG